MKILYIALGSTALSLGLLGIFLPLLPTTPFLLLAAWLYCRGSDRIYGWLMGHPYLGSYIRNYREKRAITLQSKITAVALMFAAILACILFVVESVSLKIALAAVFAGVSAHILSFRTMAPDENLRMLRCRDAGRICRAAATPPEASDRTESLVAARMAAGFRYFLLRNRRGDVGYAAMKPCTDGTLLFDGPYIAAHERGKGYARDTFLFAEYYCRYKKLETIRLTVDVRNGSGVAVGTKSGFMITGSGLAEAPDGSLTEHYFMERTLLPLHRNPRRR